MSKNTKEGLRKRKQNKTGHFFFHPSCTQVIRFLLIRGLCFLLQTSSIEANEAKLPRVDLGLQGEVAEGESLVENQVCAQSIQA